MAKVKENTSMEGKIASAEAARDAIMDAESKDSPVMSLINKRLRAARKKVKRVEEIEAIKAGGREINADQEESLKGKTKNLANIEELDRLTPLLKEAVAAEISQKLEAMKADIEAAAAVGAASKAAEEAKAVAEAHDVENSKAKALADELQAKVEEAAERAAAHEAERAEQQAAHEAHLSELQNTEKTSVKEAVMRLLQLIYFSKLFSIDGRDEQDYLHQMERDACISYVADAGDVLHQDDFNAICKFGKLISSRPQGELISHETALERCKALALDWVSAAETRIPNINMTVNDLVVKFESITSSGFYTIKPEMKGAHEMNSKGFLDSSVMTPAGRDFSNTGPFPGPSVGPQTSNNHALQQILGHHPQQVSAEREPSVEHGLANGFVPYSTGFKSSGSATHPTMPGNPLQPQHPLMDSNSQKPSAIPSNNLDNQFLSPSFQAGNFPATKPDLGGPGTMRNGSGVAPYFPVPGPTTAAPPEAPPSTADAPIGQGQGEGREIPSETAPTERKNSYNAPQGVRPRPQPSEGGRGRGPPRGRSRDFTPRGAGRRGGSGRGPRGGRGGRDGGLPSQQAPPQPSGQF